MIIKGKNIYLKKISINDSRYLFNLRKNKRNSKFLHLPPKSIKDQQKWIINNLKDKSKFDFVIYDSKNNKKIGSIALNNINLNNSESEWGRWISTGSSLQNIESVILLINFGFEHFNLKKIYSLTLCKNLKVINFHKKTFAKYNGLVKKIYLIKGVFYDAEKFSFNKKNFFLFERYFESIVQLTQ